MVKEELKNKKNYGYDNDSYNEYNSDDENYYLNDEDEEKIEEYFYDTVYIIQKNLLKFVENKSLPLCEYLELNSIKKFIIDNIEY